MSAIEDLMRQEDSVFDEAAFVQFLQDNGGVSGWGEGGRWELIEGIPIDMPPATNRHGIIAQNLERLLAAALSKTQPRLDAIREAGIRVVDDPTFRPIADVVVFDVAEEAKDGGDRFFDTCRLAAEVLSPSTRHHDLLFKRRRYVELPSCLHVLMVEQDVAQARHWARASGWTETIYADRDDLIELPEFGFCCRLKDLYARTDLA